MCIGLPLLVNKRNELLWECAYIWATMILPCLSIRSINWSLNLAYKVDVVKYTRYRSKKPGGAWAAIITWKISHVSWIPHPLIYFEKLTYWDSKWQIASRAETPSPGTWVFLCTRQRTPKQLAIFYSVNQGPGDCGGGLRDTTDIRGHYFIR